MVSFKAVYVKATNIAVTRVRRTKTKPGKSAKQILNQRCGLHGEEPYLLMSYQPFPVHTSIKQQTHYNGPQIQLNKPRLSAQDATPPRCRVSRPQASSTYLGTERKHQPTAIACHRWRWRQGCDEGALGQDGLQPCDDAVSRHRLRTAH